jgi:DNA-binding CsgD family transcriptional regulator/tetratricopeptide (TPR) repeat protein
VTTRPPLPSLPHVGRAAELTHFRDWLATVATGKGGVQLVAGASGIGKTRLVNAVVASAEKAGWQTGVGRVYAVESGVPYAVWSDAFLSLLRAIDPEARRVLSRGSSWLGTICPAFATESPADDTEVRDGKAKLLWNCAQFVARLGDKKPVLLVLENLHLADSASLELLHFVARQIGEKRVAIVCTYNEAELDRQPALRDTEQSMLAISTAKLLRLEALTQSDTEQLVCEVFGVEHAPARQLARRLYSWTRGHPFFVEEALKSLVESGRLEQRDGRWVGWDVGELDLPRTVRLAVSQRLDRLSAEARTIAGVASVIGTRIAFPVLRDAVEMSAEGALTGLDELRRAGILEDAVISDTGEHASDGDVGCEFAHPIIQDVIYDALGAARASVLHLRVGRALEAAFGERSLARADRLAFHFARAEPHDGGAKTALYLAAAGRDALARHADRAAADYLSAALERQAPGNDAASLADDLAQAKQRLGDYDGAMGIWDRARAEAMASGDFGRQARVGRRMGLTCYWGGRFEDALAHFDGAVASATQAGDDVLRARLQIDRGTCWQSLGKPDAAHRELADALETATRRGDDALLARAHRALLYLHIFVGPPETARSHGERALALGDALGERNVSWSAHVGLATLAGLTGDGPAVVRHLAVAEELADALQSPLLRAYSDEVAMQYQFANGEWDAGIVLAERTIAIARALNQRTLLTRVLAWATNFHIARGEYQLAKRYLDEAWQVGVAGAAKGRPIEVHSQLAVYAGLATYYLAVGDHKRSVEVGEQGLAIADKVGYAVWAVYRLLPVTAEAAFWNRDVARGQALRERMFRDCTRMQHRLGLAWVSAGDGLIARLKEDYGTAARLLRHAIEELERIPWVHDAARLRRWLADVLIRLGERDEGIRELRKSHEVCASLGALIEVDRARVMMKRLGLRPPSRTGGKRARLTMRESDIAQLVIERKSNKEIAASLGIATRTVTTHVANIFSKLGVSSRGELADRLRDVALGGASPDARDT